MREALGLEEALDLAPCRARTRARGRCGRGRRASRARRGPSRRRAGARRRPAPGSVEPAIGLSRRARALELDERLGRRADERDPVELEQEEVRRRVDAAQRAVERDRADAACGRSARCESTIWNASPARMCSLHALDAAHVRRRRRGTAASRRRGPTAVRGQTRGSSELQVAPGRREHLGDAGSVVEAQQHVGDDEAALRQAARRRPAAAPSARASRRGRSRGSRRPARRALRLLEARRAGRRSRRASSARGGPGRPTRAGTPRGRACAGRGRPRAA